MINPQTLRVWLVHDWLTGMRGGEKVLLELVRLFPRAKVAALFHVPGSVHPEIESRIAALSALQRFPNIERHYRHLLPLFPWAIKTLRLSPADLVISISHCVAKGVTVPAGVPHLCYCLTPMRYVWDIQDHYFQNTAPIARVAARLLRAPMQAADLALNESVTQFAGTCRNVCERITRCYHRPAALIYAPIDDQYYIPAPHPAADFFLIVSALVPYKRVDIAVRAFAGQLRGRRLVIIGKGPEENALKKLAGAALEKNIHFLGWQPDEIVRRYYQNCAALLFPGEEDYGLVPLETQACGRPVIAFARGGALETIIPLPGEPMENSDPDDLNLENTSLNPSFAPLSLPTGIFFHAQTPAALAAVVQRFEKHSARFSPSALRRHALQFSIPRFQESFLKQIATLPPPSPI